MIRRVTIEFWAAEDADVNKSIEEALHAIDRANAPRPNYVRENGIYAPWAWLVDAVTVCSSAHQLRGAPEVPSPVL